MLNNILKYYTGAKRTVLLAQDNLTKKWYHLFSVIELLPSEFPEYNIPTEEWHKGKTVRSDVSSSNDLYSIYIMVHDISQVKEALALFEDPIRNNIIEGESNYFVNSQFTREPVSEFPLVLPSNIHEKEGIASVLPRRDSGLFVWTQIDHERKVESWFRRETLFKEAKAMSQLTLRWLGFDVWAKAEHLGNIYLVAPNPYFRHFVVSLSENPFGIFYHFKFRKGISESFKIRVIDKHGDNIVLDRVYETQNHIGLLELPHEPHIVELRVYNSNNDLIGIHEAATFIKSINVLMNMKQADFQAVVKDKDGRKEIVSVEKFVALQPVTIGDSPGFNAAYYFENAERARKHQDGDFMFFHGGKSPKEKSDLKTLAKAVIRKRINSANETCYLCDPYFNVHDLIDYAFYIQNSSVTIRIINAKEFINKSQAKLLLDAIEEYNKTPFQKIECRMLKGNSILHDRFIICDHTVWFLGSSFSEFGSRATCIAKVPESDGLDLILEVEKWFNNGDHTQALKEYVIGDE